MAMNSRDEWLARTFVELADTLVADFDLIDFLSLLAERCVELLQVAEVGLALADSRGRLQVLASSTERMRTAELIEVQNGDGPCLECYRTGLPILNKRLDEAEDRWPRFSPIARESGFVMVHALPLRLRSEVIGALNVFDVALNEIPRSKVNLTQALADVATIGILQERTVKQRTDLSVQLEGALNSRIVIEQAKGIVAERLKVDMEAAFGLLRDFARRRRLQLSAVAGDIVGGTLMAAELLPARSDR
jgi:transcriptional regulator with GAF, ATPase, and Fis domain